MIYNDYYTMLPNDLLIPTKNKETNEITESLIKESKDSKILLVLDYFYTNTNRKGISIFSLEDMIIQLGYKPNTNKGKTNDKFKNIIKFLLHKEIITGINISEITPKQINYCTMNMFDIKDDKPINFFILKQLEKDKIFSVSNKDNLEILKLYCYLKARIYNRCSNYSIQIQGGKAESCYPTYNTIEHDININQNSISEYIKILSDLNMIRYGNNNLYYIPPNKDDVKESSNHYVLYDENGNWELELKESLKWGKKLLIDKGAVFLKRNPNYKTTKQINGMKGQLKKQLNQCKISKEEYDKRIIRLGV